MNCGYARLLRSIQSVIYQEGFDGSHPQVLSTFVLCCYSELRFSEFSRVAKECPGKINKEEAVSKHC